MESELSTSSPKEITSPRKKRKMTHFSENEKLMIIKVFEHVKKSWPEDKYASKGEMKEKTANILGISKTGVYRILKEYAATQPVKPPAITHIVNNGESLPNMSSTSLKEKESQLGSPKGEDVNSDNDLQSFQRPEQLLIPKEEVNDGTDLQSDFQRERKKERNREYQRAFRQRKRNLKQKDSKEIKEARKRKRHRENQRAYYQRKKGLKKNVEELFQKKLDDLQMESQLGSAKGEDVNSDNDLQSFQRPEQLLIPKEEVNDGTDLQSDFQRLPEDDVGTANTVFSPDSDVRRIVDLKYFLEQLKILNIISSHKKFCCGIKNLELIGEERLGLSSDLKVKCSECNVEHVISTINPGQNVNAALVKSAAATGVEHTKLQEIFTSINVPFMSEALYNEIDNEVNKELETIVKIEIEYHDPQYELKNETVETFE